MTPLKTRYGVEVDQTAVVPPRDEMAAFDAFVDARWAMLVRTAVLLGCSIDDAEDAAQTALLQCFRHWSRVTSAENPDAYAHQVLVNTVRRARKRMWKAEIPVAQAPDHRRVEGADLHASSVDLRRALAQLPFDQRVVVILRYLADRPEREVAEILQIPLGTVKSRLSRGVAALSRELQPSSPSEDS